MKQVTISMDLIIDEYVPLNPDAIASYLNEKLYTDPEFFGDFGAENIVDITESDWE